MPSYGKLAATLVSWMAVVGCSFDPVDLEGRACPCAEGWVCQGGVCVQGEGPPDAGTDAGETEEDAFVPPDSGPRDSGPDMRPSDLGVDAGPADSGPPDMGPPPSICETSSALFCDSFESGPVPPWNGVREVGSGTFTIDAVRPYRGAQSGHGVTTAPSSRAHVNLGLPTVASGTVHSRAWVYVPSTSQHTTMSFLLIGESTPPDYPLTALQIRPEGTSGVYVGAPHRRIATGGTASPFPLDRWVCTTLSVDVGGNAQVRATVDGVVVADETVVDPIVASGDFFNAGIEFTNADSMGAELFIDEVEVDTSPLPCE